MSWKAKIAAFAKQVGPACKFVATGFDRLTIQVERIADRQEMSLDLQQEMLAWQRLSFGFMLKLYGENVADPRLRELFRVALVPVRGHVFRSPQRERGKNPRLRCGLRKDDV